MIVGTPDDAIEQIETILERSGGMGGLLGLAHEWASTDKTLRSYELWARYVAPHFQGQIDTIRENRDWIEVNQTLAFRGSIAAFTKAYADAGKEMPEKMRQNFEAMRRARDAAAAASSSS